MYKLKGKEVDFERWTNAKIKLHDYNFVFQSILDLAMGIVIVLLISKI